MRGDAALSRLAQEVGVVAEYQDMQGITHVTPPETQWAMLRANGYPAQTHAEIRETLAALHAARQTAYLQQEIVLRCDQPCDITCAAPVTWHVLCEGSQEVLAEGRAQSRIALPGLRMGVHTLVLEGAKGVQETWLITAPAGAPSLEQIAGTPRCWGVMAALYGLGPAASQIGSFDDLAQAAAVCGQAGAAFLGINPVHALGMAAGDTISPYSPTHRGFLNTDHITMSSRTPTPGDAGDLLDYAQHRHAQRPALRREFEAFLGMSPAPERSAFDAFCDVEGARLIEFAIFEQVSQQHGPDWRVWPHRLHDPKNALHEISNRDLMFHKWLQWRADTQLASAQKAARDAGMALGLYLDLAVGARVGGAETWGTDTATADGVSLGAPPDHLSPAGQNWQLAALSPVRLKATRYAALRAILAKNMRHAGLMRIDHALGLSRSFWIPQDGSPGAYMRQPLKSLVALIAIEAHRAGTVIVGEDLGLVPDGFRAEMARHGFYGYCVLQYEKDAEGVLLPPEHLRAQSLACFGTHDTPTLAGFWQGRDIDWWHRLGWIDASDAARARRARVQEKRQLVATPAPKRLPRKVTAAVRDKVYADLAASPAALVAVQLDDMLSLTEAQNLPGTVDAHPNWRRRYPVRGQALAKDKALQATSLIMARAARNTAERKDER
ncbi:4-alpha-glucanotransferase [Roseobacter denitrificans]|uniref:4-alpha-glucanotransferase n=1 Tax=Roseobacter denitrificans (strain ATCC 33942 / OCh 114) TaxID=375451 RepID=Q165E6_ROSDO|nr:4-alpha-glucanotransferase [Roseobacter denitrificans]ABG32397.1 4-alpha-glucanotransferase [Roseobacter denitrificans OCh 114]AVL54762.1 4-alpha-glucanotransferase [Roseobacter denitrificans]SFF81278.1 4-alpha-glucanotransferase [Roseobacter denitrificans OCh 114]